LDADAVAPAMAGKWGTGAYHFVGSVRACYNLTVRALTIGYFFIVAALAGLAVWMAHRLQARFRQPWLSPYSLFLASWGALALLLVVQYTLAWEFLPHSVWGQLQTITRPLIAVAFGSTFYFAASFTAQLTGGRLSRTFSITLVTTWTVAGVAISVGGVLAGEPPPATLTLAATIVTLLFKVGIVYGSIVRALLVVRRIEDPLDREGLRRFLLLQLGGLIAFDLAVRDVTSLAGVHVPDAVIGLVQVGGAYPALWWLAVFLRRREVARPAEPLTADVKPELAALGLSARECDVIDLLLIGLSHKEVAVRLFISPDTVKKHTYNAYRKLGVQNRVQLTYFVQNRVARRG
jgi:DNA-binding CsgD family transcriptional regulator